MVCLGSLVVRLFMILYQRLSVPVLVAVAAGFLTVWALEGAEGVFEGLVDGFYRTNRCFSSGGHCGFLPQRARRLVAHPYDLDKEKG
jgi:hypothetical protein